MAMAANVLVYGKDERLLDTRRMVLEKSGYCVRMASKLTDIGYVDEVDVELLILCYTVSMEECGRAIARCQVRWPAAKSLFLSVGTMEGARSLSSEVLNALDGPEKLISTVGKIVGARHDLHPPIS